MERLHFIGVTSTYLSIEAFRMAITEAKHGKNVQLYLKLVQDFASIAPNDPMATADSEWEEEKCRQVKDEQDKLEHELKSYKNNLIKESIRVRILQDSLASFAHLLYQMGNEDLGHFYFACGDYSAAGKAYARMREHCTSIKHIVDLHLRLVYVSIAQKSWSGVHNQLAKLEGLQIKQEDKPKLEPIVTATHGLAYMCTGNAQEAAVRFIQTAPSYLTLDQTAGIQWNKEILTGNDIAVYGGLCALASMNRSELQSQVLSNNDFRNFLELEPHIRRAISLFCSSKYSACLEILESYRTDYLLDIFLAPVVREFYRAIRTKCIVEYFIPFSCVTLDEMAKRFQTTGEADNIQDELLEMISSGCLNARIDLVDRLLISPPTNPRYTAHAEALAMAENYDHQLRLRLFKMNMLNAGLEIRPSKQEPRESNIGEGLRDSLRGLGTRIGF